MNPVYFDLTKEMDQVAIFLSADADLIADKLDLRIKQMMASGMDTKSILTALASDLDTAGPMFSTFESTLKKTVYPVIDNVAQGALVQANPEAGGWEWVTTSYDPCVDCLPRHGLKKSYEDWKALGLPRSGFSRCGDNCKCVLAPVGQVAPGLADGPVTVPTLGQARSDFLKRLATDPALQARLEEYRSALRGK